MSSAFLTSPSHSPSPWDLLAVGVLIVSGSLYAIGRWRLARTSRPPVRDAVAFAIGWAAMLIAVLPPVDALATILFSAHMFQHELLMLLGAPLMIAGRPLSTCLWGLPVGMRASVAGVFQPSTVGGGLWRWATAPLVAWVLHAAVLWVWHVPALYEWAVRVEGVHAAQHAMFVGSAMLFWWGLIYGRYGRAGYGASVLYVFTTVVHTGLLGAVFALTPTPLYAVYADRSADPVADQQLAGLVMWVPAGIVLSVTGIALFAAWLGESERRAVGRRDLSTSARGD